MRSRTRDGHVGCVGSGVRLHTARAEPVPCHGKLRRDKRYLLPNCRVRLILLLVSFVRGPPQKGGSLDGSAQAQIVVPSDCECRKGGSRDSVADQRYRLYMKDAGDISWKHFGSLELPCLTWSSAWPQC